MTLLCLDMGGTSLKFALYQNGQLSQQSSFPTPADLESFYQLLDQEVARYSAYHFSGIAISSPGAVNKEKGIIEGASAIPYLSLIHI